MEVTQKVSYCTVGYNSGNETFVTNPNGIQATGNTGTWAGNTQNQICLRWQEYSTTTTSGTPAGDTCGNSSTSPCHVQHEGPFAEGVLLYAGIFMTFLVFAFIANAFKNR